MTTQLGPFLSELREQADAADATKSWPNTSWDVLRQTGALRWSIPKAYGGDDLEPTSILSNFEQLSSACLTTVFLLSQREAAVRRICDFGTPQILEQYLPPLARGETHITVGLSQLTTSRQHRTPSLQAATSNGGYVLNGLVPWVTGACQCDHFLIGATLPDSRQVLLLIPKERKGLEIDAPMSLAAVQGSMTAGLRFEQVAVPSEEVLAGPVEKVLTASRGGGGGLETSCLALGLAGAAIDYLHEQAQIRVEAQEIAEQCERARTSIRKELHTLVAVPSADAFVNVRVRATNLALHASQAALLIAKGTGFVQPHPAQRWARQALFFLVWSCPRPTSEGLLEGFAERVKSIS